MDNSRKIIITLIILVVVLVIALTGAIIYIILQGNNNTNVPTTNNNINNIDDTNTYTNDIQDDDMTDAAEELARETFNSQFTSYEGNNLNSAQIRSLFSVIEASNLSNTEHQVTIDNTGITSEEELTDTGSYTVELIYGDDDYVDEIKITETNTTTPENEDDMEKLLFNTKFTSYAGEITGEQFSNLLQVIQQSNNDTPDHQVVLTSNNLQQQDLNSINPTDTYVVTLTYDTEGYVQGINVDRKV